MRGKGFEWTRLKTSLEGCVMDLVMHMHMDLRSMTR